MDGRGGDDVITEKKKKKECQIAVHQEWNAECTFIGLRRDIYDEARLAIQISTVNVGEPHEEATFPYTFNG